MSSPHAHPDEFFLDPAAVRRSFDAASAGYDAAAAVQAEIRARLLERLDIVRIDPRNVVDLGAATGHASRALKQRYRSAEVFAIDLSPAMLRAAQAQQRWRHRFYSIAADAHRLPLRDAGIDLVLSNLMLEWCHDPDRVFAEMSRVLRPQGLLTFTTLGPDTLKELRQAWRSLDDRVHVHRFIDMHDLGDALMRAGFAEPVMDTERLTVTYRDLPGLLQELRRSGSANVAHGRSRGLLGRRKFVALERSYASAHSEPLRVSVEVIYGHAWRAATAVQRRIGDEVRIPMRGLRRRGD